MNLPEKPKRLGVIMSLIGVLYGLGTDHGIIFAQGPTPPPAAPLAFDPPPPNPPQKIFTPFNETKLLAFRTKGGLGEVAISLTLPPGVPASAFEFVTPPPHGAPGSSVTTQASQVPRVHFSGVPAGPASRELKFKGCESGCPRAFTITVTAKDSANATIAQSIQFVLTTAKRRPILNSIAELSALSLAEISATHPASLRAARFYRVNADPETYSTQDEGSEIIAIYSGGLRYSLGSNLSSVRIPRLGRERNVQVLLKNPYGESSAVTINLSPDTEENLPPAPRRLSFGENLVQVPGDKPRRFVRQHGGVLGDSGTDSFHAEWTDLSQGCTNCSTTRGSITTGLACGQVGAVYNGSRVTVISTFNNASLRDEPRVGELLGTGQLINVKWDYGPAGSVAYELVFSIFFVEGVCRQKVR